LGEGGNSFSEDSIGYITTDYSTGLTYARTLTGRFITSSEIKAMSPGTFHYFVYSWEESYGAAYIGDGYYTVYNVISTSDTEIGKKEVFPYEAPTDENQIPLASTTQFQAINDLYGTYMDDYWIVGYGYKIKKGEVVSASFYAPAIDQSSSTATEVVIDIRLTKSGTAETTTETSESNIIALNMSQIRNRYITSSTKTMNVKFRFYVDGQTDPYTTAAYQMASYDE
jgi:hypothetical protein